MNKREVLKERMTALKNGATEKYSNKHFVEQRLMPDNTVRIDVILPPETEIFDSLSPVGYGKLNPEIYAYIDEQAYFIPAEYDITVRFAGRTLSAEEQRTIDRSVHEHYNLQVYDKIDDIRRNRMLGIFLLIFGAIALAAYFFLTLYSKQEVFLEIVSIVGTFSVWEAVDCWLIQGHERKTELNNALQMALVKVIFDDDKPEDKPEEKSDSRP